MCIMAYTCSYQTLSDLICRMKEVHHQFLVLSKKHDRLKKKIAASVEQAGIVVNEETHADLVTITSESRKFIEEHDPN